MPFCSAKPTEPPPPFPPPPPLVPLDSKHLEEQIGLLKPYYQQRIDSLIGPAVPPSGLSVPTNPAATSSPNLLNSFPTTLPMPVVPQPLSDLLSRAASPPFVQLPDDPAPLAHSKMGPLGQILKSAPTAGNSKKKAAAKPKPPAASGLPDGDVPAESPAATPTATAPDTPKKPKGTPVKKKKNTIEILPPVIVASA